ncbi:leucine--tRNA ligase, mitochondrial-like [Paramacrobiotus metropolitanus]|uniref:leucine--tRNA ligase, mitochondrial-like n=1 Tax=Paramacrobiotus metropolitanus TaxID=2943436 RepID=UPI00244656FA|nr:leucine--tRNA ligase, mitochondrial-like [Paramacrobiotus metropolitanus]
MLLLPQGMRCRGIQIRISACSLWFRNPHRHIFSQTGTWDPVLTVEKKKEIESFWRKQVAGEISRPETSKSLGKYYVLSMFPYPSGRLHMGHVRVYAISDSMARYRKMQGYEVLHPMGWDAFGLPAENAAREQNVSPQTWTETNIEHMKKQLLNMGFGFDWDREFRTCDPSYYKWTQYLFLKLWEAGLAYRKEAFVNWDPIDKTVLANEQVDENGCSWRSGAKVEKKLLKQWFFRTSHYSVPLRDGLKDVSNWRDIVALQQMWIGDICGNAVEFELLDNNGCVLEDRIQILVKDAKELTDINFILVSPAHALFSKFPEVAASGKLPVTCRNPLDGTAVPIYVEKDSTYFDKDCDIRLGTPRISDRDRVFAQHRGLPVSDEPIATGVTMENLKQMVRKRNGHDLRVSPPQSHRLKDWLISRQRYWGTPIPIVHCPSCGVVPIPFHELPVKLPTGSATPGKGIGNLKDEHEWLDTECPKCTGPAKRETDTMDTFVDSSWYLLRFLDPRNDSELVAKDKAFQYMPVDLYIGGKEHALLHLFYARFIGYFLYEQGLLPDPEPFKQLLTQGLVMGKSYRNSSTGRYLKPEEIDFLEGKPVEKATQSPVTEDWEKMSKSKYNGLDPDEAIREHGVDAIRLFMLGSINPRSDRRWDPEIFKGLLNWQMAIWSVVATYLKACSGAPSTPTPDQEREKWEAFLWDSRNYYLKGVNWAMDISFSMNMAIAKLLGLTNSLRKIPSSIIASSPEYHKTLQQIVIMLFPFIPHFSAELWSAVRSVPAAVAVRNKNVWEMTWPELDYSYPLDLTIKSHDVEVAVLKIPRKDFDVMTKQTAFKMALDSPIIREIVPVDLQLERVDFELCERLEAFLIMHDSKVHKLVKTKVKEEKAARKSAKAEKIRV